ncbi:hypothetical protein [Paenibacillus sp. CF384]|uniref:hypothetical protein n=1 Tax=Paenibacillus sp. CF384 TaxID=1884382 RepID=UPI000B821055|nr:hypothetical protein [Paenibacillus sp. CF384]
MFKFVDGNTHIAMDNPQRVGASLKADVCRAMLHPPEEALQNPPPSSLLEARTVSMDGIRRYTERVW